MRRDLFYFGLLTAVMLAALACRACLAAQNAKPPSPTGRTKHWAFQTPVRPAIPKVKAVGRVRNPIDAFLLADLERKRITFSPNAPKRTLIRRVYYDLIGFPPTPSEVDEFEKDLRTDAYERQVDKLLADPRYGERWARHWLDVAGYADSEGILEEDLIRPNAWRYRDYVIKSFNEDKPYNRFLLEQIAGDEISNYRTAEKWTPEIEECLVATGFLRTAVDATRPDFNPHQFEEYQYRMLNDTQTILSTAVLGVTLQCARCHDHKYEPLTQRDYYGMQAILRGAIRPEGPLLPSKVRQVAAATSADQKHAKEVNERTDSALKKLSDSDTVLSKEFRLKAIDDAKSVPDDDKTKLKQAFETEEGKRTPEQKALLTKHKALVELSSEALSKTYPTFGDKVKAIAIEREAEQKKKILIPEIRALYDQDSKPPQTRILLRGEWTKPGDPVAASIPAVLSDPKNACSIAPPPNGAASTGARKALAEWIINPNNPLTARVIVNRVWSHHFGVGIVSTLENFGVSGAKPTNRALLDWLACEFVKRSWSVKLLHRLIVTSTAYRQASVATPAGMKSDPDDKLLWRQRQRRLEAGAMRDGMLAACGNLDSKMYGEPVGNDIKPTGDVIASGEENGGRRTIYLLIRRSRPVTILNTFDEPIMETNCTRRTVSTTATQALALMNSSFISAQAKRFAERILKERSPQGGGSSPADAETVTYAYLLALSRAPKPTELKASMDFLKGQFARYNDGKNGADVAFKSAYADFCQALLSSNEFVYVD